MSAESESPFSSTSPRSSLIITVSVIATILLAIVLALADTMQVALPAPIRPTLLSGLIGGDAPFSEFLPTGTPSPTATATKASTTTVDGQPEIAMMPTEVSMLVVRSCGNVPVGWIRYTVQPGDNLFRLSLNTGATIDDIVQANCLDINVLYSWTQIYLPSIPRDLCGPPLFWSPQPVKLGDTLYSLARKYGTTVYAIMQANCLVSSLIYADRDLYFPPVPTTATPMPTQQPTPTATSPPAATSTKKPTATPVTPDPTATATNAPTSTSTPTPTGIATVSPTASPTASPTNTPANTHTPTATPTATATPSFTPSPTHTATATPTPSNTPSPTSTPTVTSSPTLTPSPSPTPSHTPIPSAAPSTASP